MLIINKYVFFTFKTLVHLDLLSSIACRSDVSMYIYNLYDMIINFIYVDDSKGSTSGMISNNTLLLVTVAIVVTAVLLYSWNKSK